MPSPRPSDSSMMTLGVGGGRDSLDRGCDAAHLDLEVRLAKRRSSPADWIAAAAGPSTVSQKAWIDTRGAGAMCSSRGAASAGLGSGVTV